jgi:hypothetical protein
MAKSRVSSHRENQAKADPQACRERLVTCPGVDGTNSADREGCARAGPDMAFSPFPRRGGIFTFPIARSCQGESVICWLQAVPQVVTGCRMPRFET